MATANITVIGSLNIDHIFFVDRLPNLGESYEARKYEKALGGKGANAAIAAYRSCHKQSESEPGDESGTDIHVRMVGAVGEDLDGTWMRRTIGEAMVDVEGVKTVKGITGMTFIIVEELEDDDGDARDNRLIYTIGANATLKPAQFEEVEGLSNGTRPDLIISQLEISLETVETILKTAHKANIKVLLNAAPANVILPELYRYITHLLVNETEAAGLYGCVDIEEVKESWADIAKFFLDAGVENFVITLGAKGAFYARYGVTPSGSVDPKHIISGHVEAFHVDHVIDPTGAGDTFTGVYAAEYVRQTKEQEEWDIEKAARRACAAGALTVTKAGAQAGIPWAEEIDGFVRTLSSASAHGDEAEVLN